MKKTSQAVLLVLVAVGLIASALILLKRNAYEKANRTVEIVVDNDNLRLSTPLGMKMQDVYRRFAAAGATTLGVYEVKLGDLIDTEQVRLMPRKLENSSKTDTGARFAYVLVPRTQAAEDLLHAYFPLYFGPDSCPKGLDFCSAPQMPMEELRKISLGIPLPDTTMYVSPRLVNNPADTEASIAYKADALGRIGNLSAVVFEGDSALGWPALQDTVVKEFKSRPKIIVGDVEMVVQNGNAALIHRLKDQTVPVHGISRDEMKKATPPANIARYVRAARERGVRVFYVRLFVDDFGKNRADALDENIAYVKSLSDALKADGYVPGQVKPLPPFAVSRILRALVAAGAAALCLLLAGAYLPIPDVISILLSLLCIPVFAAAPQGLAHLLIKLAALTTACIAPGMATAIFFLKPREGKEPSAMGFGANVAAWLGSTVVSLAAGIFIAALLTDRNYFLRIDVFSGVKFAFVAPLLVVFYGWLRATGVKLKEFLDSPVRYMEAGLAIILAGVLAVYLLRSGNQPPVGVSDVEKSFRGSLEMFFYARPRTKEFLLGHPAMLLLGLIPMLRFNFIYPAILMLAVMGQVSVVNSFCHLHTPISFTLLRVALGVILGFVVGAVVRVAAALALRMTRNLRL